MKDKRNYLKIACLIESIYIIYVIIYNLFFVKSNNDVMANLFMVLISIYFTILLYKESKKDITYLKNNNIKILISSIWMFLEPIIPGILGFFFLSSLRDKKSKKLPIIKNNDVSKKEKIISFLIICIFIVVMFVLPRFNYFSKIPSNFVYCFILVYVIILCYKYLLNDLKIFIKNFKVYFPFVIKRYLIMLGLMLIVAIPIVVIKQGVVSNNQEVINTMFKKVPLITLLLSCFYAPLVEESIFRLSLSKLINNRIVFIIVSGFLFGLLHVINDFSSISDIFYVLQYATIGFCLAKAYSDSNNIFVSISMHFIQNFLAGILVLVLL